MWDEIFPPNIFNEGKTYTYETHDGLYISATMVKVECPECGEKFVGNKREAGLFLKGHSTYHDFIQERAEYYGGV